MMGHLIRAQEEIATSELFCYFACSEIHLKKLMLKILQGVPTVLLLVIATSLEVSGDAVVRSAIYNSGGVARVALFLLGAALLFGYGSFLNFAPVEFGKVVGLYIATLFVIWQVINFIFFKNLPTLPTVIGGALIVAGGAIVTLWSPG